MHSTLLSSTCESIEKTDKPPNELITLSLYDQKLITSNDNIKAYSPLPVELLWEMYEKGKVVYELPLSPTVITKVVDKKSRKSFALKQLIKKRLHENYLHEFAKNECVIHYSMGKLSNKIVQVPHYFEDSEAYYMIMEYSTYHGYFEDLLEKKFQPILNEKLLKFYATDMLTSLALIHDNNIIHCDIKPENFLLFTNVMNKDDYNNSELEIDSNRSFSSYEDGSEETTILKLADFGLSHLIADNNKTAFAKYSCGTLNYKAPELTNNSYIDTSSDMWSFGIMLYQMATAYLPRSGDIPFRQIDWKHLENEGYYIKDLIVKCLNMNPPDRITAKEALKHHWLSGNKI